MPSLRRPWLDSRMGGHAVEPPRRRAAFLRISFRRVGSATDESPSNVSFHALIYRGQMRSWRSSRYVGSTPASSWAASTFPARWLPSRRARISHGYPSGTAIGADRRRPTPACPTRQSDHQLKHR
jgi:hypothetical protein